jgi:hypothetical protein
VLGKTDLEWFRSEVGARYFAVDQKVLSGGEAVLEHEEWSVGPDGRTRWGMTSKIPLRDAEGRVTGLVGISRDTTGRKQAEELLKGRLEELVRWQDMMLGREDRVQELKGEINALCRRLGEAPRYPSQEADSASTESVAKGQ